MRKPAWFAAGAVFTVLVFQLFFRFDYVHVAGARVMRIDRLSGASCDIPCIPAPRPTPTPFDRVAYALEFGDRYSLAKQRAIRIAQS